MLEQHLIIETSHLARSVAADALKLTDFLIIAIILESSHQNTRKSFDTAKGNKQISLKSSRDQYKLTLISFYMYLQSFSQFQYIGTFSF